MVVILNYACFGLFLDFAWCFVVTFCIHTVVCTLWIVQWCWVVLCSNILQSYNCVCVFVLEQIGVYRCTVGSGNRPGLHCFMDDYVNCNDPLHTLLTYVTWLCDFLLLILLLLLLFYTQNLIHLYHNCFNISIMWNEVTSVHCFGQVEIEFCMSVTWYFSLYLCPLWVFLTLFKMD